MDYKACLKKLRELFSVHNPVAHWWYQRLTAVALVPLSVWLLIFLHKALTAPYAETVHWLQSPINGACILAWVVAVIYHAALGVQVVLEDYVSTLALRDKAIRATNLIFMVLGFIAIVAIFDIWEK
jgi:succinate dehydrogenase / fumarate reductase membrane anchor subunit